VSGFGRSTTISLIGFFDEFGEVKKLDGDRIYRFSGTMRDLVEMVIEAEGNYLEKSWSEVSSKSQKKAVILVIAENADTLLYQQLDHRKINVARVLKN
jgi:hypothetical protein